MEAGAKLPQKLGWPSQRDPSSKGAPPPGDTYYLFPEFFLCSENDNVNYWCMFSTEFTLTNHFALIVSHDHPSFLCIWHQKLWWIERDPKKLYTQSYVGSWHHIVDFMTLSSNRWSHKQTHSATNSQAASPFSIFKANGKTGDFDSAGLVNKALPTVPCQLGIFYLK